MAEAVIRTGFGSVSIAFANHEELEARIAELKKELPLLDEFAAKVTPAQPRTPKPQLESWYRFGPTGKLELLKIPEKQFDAVCLVLFAYHPTPVAAVEIEDLVGIDDVARRVLAQASYKDTFRKVDDKNYSLTFSGLRATSEKFKIAPNPIDTPEGTVVQGK